MPAAAVNGTSIYYEIQGEGAPLVLLPGLGCTHVMWDPQVARFADDHRIVTFDPRGVGKSGRLTGWRDILSQQADDLAALFDELGIDRAVVCGVSYGASSPSVSHWTIPHVSRAWSSLILSATPDRVRSVLPHSGCCCT